MKLFLYQASLRAQFGARDIEHAVEVPDAVAVSMLNTGGICRAVRGGEVPETAVVSPEEVATADADGGEGDGVGAGDVGDEGDPEGAEDGQNDLPEWTLGITPAQSLARNPTGPNADLAQRYLDAAETD